MKTEQFFGMLLTILFWITSAFGQSTIPPSCFTNSHDITSLQAWGPYSKRYAGISHIPDMKAGMRFDFSVMPGYYRNRQFIPHVLFESSYYPWDINPSMSRITYRYEMEWKDQVFTDVTYYILDEHRTLVSMNCVNNTAVNQNLVLNLMAYIDYEGEQPQFKTPKDSNIQWHNATDYISNEPVHKSPQYNLVYDGWKRNEMRTSQSLSGFVLGKGFGKNKGDKVSYEINILPGKEKGMIGFRYNTPKGKTSTFQLKGITESRLELQGTGEYNIVSITYTCKEPGKYTLELISEGTYSTDLDGFFIGSEEDIKQIKILPRKLSFIPEIKLGKTKQDFILKYPECDNYYGIAWNYQASQIREVLDNNLESFFRKKTHDHV